MRAPTTAADCATTADRTRDLHRARALPLLRLIHWIFAFAPSDCNGLSAGVDHLGRVVTAAPGSPTEGTHSGTEGIYLAEYDIAALRQFRATPRGAALTKPLLEPQLCRIPQVASHIEPNCNAHRMWL